MENESLFKQMISYLTVSEHLFQEVKGILFSYECT